MLIREYPAITQSYIPQRGIRRPPVCAVTAPSPYLHLVPAFLRAILRMCLSGAEKKEQGENTKTFCQRKVSWAARYSQHGAENHIGCVENLQREHVPENVLKKDNVCGLGAKIKEGGGPGLPASFSFPFLRGNSVA